MYEENELFIFDVTIFSTGLPLTIVFISACSRWGGYGNERAYVYYFNG